jgi:hypothetical protein
MLPQQNEGEMTNEQLLQEIEDLLRTMPPRATLRHDKEENYSWLGRVAAVINAWNSTQIIAAGHYLDTFQRGTGHDSPKALAQLLMLIHQARHDLRMKTTGPLAVAVGTSNVFDYFDEIRKIIEEAKSDLLFVDPYLDAEFVSRYLGHVTSGVNVRLLARERLNSLLPAVEAFTKQNILQIAVRSASNFHDRYVFIDRMSCYQSGASFKDGAKNAPTTITQITDAFTAVLDIYEDIWRNAHVEI